MRIGGGSSDDRVNLGWRADGVVVAGRMGRNLMGRIRGLLGRDDGYKGGTVGTDGGCGLCVASLARLLALERMCKVGELVWLR